MLFLKQSKLSRLWRLLVPLALVLLLAGFVPAAQGIQRFVTILTQNIEVSKSLTAATADVSGALTFGADNLYPLGYASANQQVVCGTTATFTGTLTITPTGLTTVTYPVAIQVTDPITTAGLLSVSAPTTSTFVLKSWAVTAPFGAGTTGVQAHWCALGDQ